MSRLRQESIYRYRVSRDHVDTFLLRADRLLEEAAAAFESEVFQELEEFLDELSRALRRPVSLSPEARFWMIDNIALVLSAKDKDLARAQLLQETLFLLRD